MSKGRISMKYVFKHGLCREIYSMTIVFCTFAVIKAFSIQVGGTVWS